MEIDQLLNASGGMPATLLDLKTQVTGDHPQQRFYREYLVLPFSSTNRKLSVVRDTGSISGTFRPWSYTASPDTSDSMIESVGTRAGESEEYYEVKLRAPRPVIRVVTSTGRAKHYFRIDGDAVAAEATVNQSSDLAPDQFVSQHFAFKTVSHPADPQSSEIQSVQLKGFPTRPRLGIEYPDGSVVYFWQKPGLFDSAVNVECSSDTLAGVLQTYLDSLPTPLDINEIRLVAESDAECQFELSAFHIEISGMINTFALDTAEAKTVLRFSGQKSELQSAPLALPHPIMIKSATVAVTESMQSAHPAEEGCDALPPSQQTGALVSSQQSIAQPVLMDMAMTISGVMVMVTAIEPGTGLRLEIQTDAADQPSGSVLAEHIMTPAPIGQPQWVTCQFGQNVFLSGNVCWLVMAATQGHAVWQSQDQAGSISILARAGKWGQWTKLTGLKDLRMTYCLLSRQQTPEPVPGFQLQIGTYAAPLNNPVDHTYTVNFADALRQYLLQAAPVAPVTIDAVSYLPGFLTLKDLLITYDWT